MYLFLYPVGKLSISHPVLELTDVVYTQEHGIHGHSCHPQVIEKPIHTTCKLIADTPECLRRSGWGEKRSSQNAEGLAHIRNTEAEDNAAEWCAEAIESDE